MEKVILTPSVEPAFQGFQSTMEICDSQGDAKGFFVPIGSYKKLLANLEIPYSKEELERRKQATDGGSLQDFWQRMGQS
jgi:hypothetical protein